MDKQIETCFMCESKSLLHRRWYSLWFMKLKTLCFFFFKRLWYHILAWKQIQAKMNSRRERCACTRNAVTWTSLAVTTTSNPRRENECWRLTFIYLNSVSAKPILNHFLLLDIVVVGLMRGNKGSVLKYVHRKG